MYRVGQRKLTEEVFLIIFCVIALYNSISHCCKLDRNQQLITDRGSKDRPRLLFSDPPLIYVEVLTILICAFYLKLWL